MYFYDSYALIEIAKGNRRYARYRVSRGVTSKLNLLELYYVLLCEGREDLALSCLQEHLAAAVDFPGEILPLAARFRQTSLGATGRRFSYIDVLGYVHSRTSGYTFLTGAHEFAGLPNVEFVR
jgi:hypothetical protein